MSVEFELAYLNGSYARVEPKTARSRRAVPLPLAAQQAVDAQRERVRRDGFVPVATGPVFVNQRGGALSGSWVTHRLYEIETAAGEAAPAVQEPQDDVLVAAQRPRRVGDDDRGPDGACPDGHDAAALHRHDARPGCGSGGQTYSVTPSVTDAEDQSSQVVRSRPK